MAISDRINEMYTHVGDVYDTITNVDLPTNKNIQNIPSTMRSSYLEIMNNGTDKIWNNWEKVTGEGETLTLNSTEEAPMKINLKGNTSQETTTGQNLLPNNQTTQTINGVTFTMNSDKSVTVKGTATVNTDYYFVGTSSEYEDFGLTTGTYNLNGCTGGSEQTYMLFTVMNRNGNIYYYNNTYAGGRSMIVETGDKFRIFIRVISGKNVNTTIYPQINVGSTALSYEPYTNGASPNPDYPQDIHVVSGDNTIKVEGKNLLKLDFVTERPTFAGLTFTHTDSTFTLKGTTTGSWTIFNLKEKPLIENGATYTFSANITGTNPSMTISCYFWNKSGQQIDNIRMSKNDNYEITKTINFNGPDDLVYSYATFVIESLTNNSAYDLSAEVQLEKGTQATPYEAYKGASYPISLGVENLLQNNLTSGTNNGITYVVNEDKSVTLNGTATAITWLILNSSVTLEAGTYTMTSGYSGNDVRVYSTGLGVYTLDGQRTVTKTSSVSGDVAINIPSGTICNNLTIKPMIEKGSKANSYTPYRTTPIELCKIGDYQDSIKKSTGKNLCNATFELGGIDTTTGQNGSGTDRVRTKDYVEVKPNTTYTLSGVQGSRVVCFYNSSKAYLSYEVVGSQSTSGTFTTPNDTSYIRWYIIQTNTNINEMLNEGSTALPYEPYGTSWYLNKQIGKVVLDGSENWAKGASRPFYTLLINDILRLQSAGNNATLFCNYLSPSTPATIWGNNINGITNLDDGNAIRIRIQDNPYTITTFKEWLNDVKPVVYYVLATPTYTEITDSTLLSQLEALNGSKSYTTQTNISQENNDKPFILDVTALKQLTTEEI